MSRPRMSPACFAEIEEALRKSRATRVAVDWRVYSDNSGETA